MLSFIRRYIDPADRLGEVLFGLIMALGFTGAVRLGVEDADNRTLFVSILGCNVAWAIVDGVMYVLGAIFEQGRKARLVRDVRRAPGEAGALQLIGAEFDDQLEPLLTAAEREQFYRSLLAAVRRADQPPLRLRGEDVLGGVAVALIIVLATLPVLVPYLVVRDANVAVRVSNAIALTLVFLLGVRWGQLVGGRSLRIATGLTAVGLVLVLITIALGG
jgi:VIT1/CCC1 family predicted Fe2+/Mn2+ transporter